MSKEKEIILLGCNGNAWDVVEIIKSINNVKSQYVINGYLDDDPEKIGKIFCGYPVIGKLTAAKTFTTSCFAYCIGSAKTFQKRPEILSKIEVTPEKFPNLIHTNAIVSDHAHIGTGSIIGPYCKLDPYVKVGNFCIILSHCIVSHQTKLGDYCTLAANVSIAGNVTIGENCFIGSGSCIKENITLGSGNLIGMGAVVCKNFASDLRIVGIPAKES